jgi:hypothetical protein
MGHKLVNIVLFRLNNMYLIYILYLIDFYTVFIMLIFSLFMSKNNKYKNIINLFEKCVNWFILL